ncbi:hypothetical protein C458_17190 [Haloferax sp. ATCC BAA-644]|nr:hypothetical protein C458_17190 [Haloferax sp. ATCC BAA-644]
MNRCAVGAADDDSNHGTRVAEGGEKGVGSGEGGRSVLDRGRDLGRAVVAADAPVIGDRGGRGPEISRDGRE